MFQQHSRRSLPILGALLLTLGAAPAAFAQEALPPPSHPLDFGYYFVGGKWEEGTSHQHFSEVSCFTNLYVLGPADYETDAGPGVPTCSLDGQPVPEWMCRMRSDAEWAVAHGKRLYLRLDLPKQNVDPQAHAESIGDLVRVVGPVWGAVSYVELADEPSWGPAGYIDQWLGVVRDAILAENVGAVPPLGITFERDVVRNMSPESNKIVNSGLDFVGLEAYVAPDERSTETCDTLATLRQVWFEQRTKVGAKRVVAIGQAYDRNGCWDDVAQLADLQRATYRLIAGDAAVDALIEFSYSREGAGCVCGSYCGGTRLYRDDLVPVHKQIADAIPGLGPIACPESAPPEPSCSAPPVETGPSGLRISEVEQAGVTLEWLPGTKLPAHLRLYRTKNGNQQPGYVEIEPATASSWEALVQLPWLVGPGWEYCFWLTASYADGSPPRSTETVCTTVYRGAPELAPVLQTPSGCISKVRPYFKWDAVPMATGYYFSAQRIADGVHVVDDPNVEASPYRPSIAFEPRVRYAWKVKACNNIDCGAWSDFGYFTPLCSPRADFNGDGFSDLQLRDRTTEDETVWFLAGYQQIGSGLLSPARPATTGWWPAATNDFDLDGSSDLVWRNESSGNLAIWHLDGLTRRDGVAVTGIADPNWTLVGSGDFSLDGRADLVWRLEGTDQIVVWLMNDATKVGEAPILPPHPGYASRQLIGVGDLDMDGRPDLLWRDPATFDLVLWHMNGTQLVVPGYLDPQTGPNLGWNLVAIEDVDRDGANDLVWQNSVSNRIVVWRMNGPTRISGAYLDPDGSTTPQLEAIGPR